MIRQRANDKNAFSAETITILSSALLFVFAVFYATQVYVQFGLQDIVKVALMFLGLFLALTAIFLPRALTSSLLLNRVNILFSALAFIWLLALLYSPSRQFIIYYQTFPMLQTELGLGWSQDSAFHVSIINSFKTLGYPSIGQHGAPVVAYHVLSHGVDALLLHAADLEAWEAYGLFYYFKSVVFLTAISFFIATVCKDKKYYVFILSLLFFTPVIIATWHAIGSHGLWFTTLIMLFSAPWVYKLISQNTMPSNRDLALLFILLVIVSLGKVSSGFMYAAVTGFALFFANYKNYRVYIFGLLLLAFFVGYNSLMSAGESSLDFFSVNALMSFISLQTDVNRNQLHQVYGVILLAGVLGWLFRSSSMGRVFISGLLTAFVLAVIVSIYPTLSKADVWYFTYGLSSVLMLLVYQSCIGVLHGGKLRELTLAAYIKTSYFKSLLVVCLIVLSSQFSLPSFHLLRLSSGPVKKLYSAHFYWLNEYDNNLDANIIKQIQGRGIYDFNHYPRPLTRFKDELSQFMAETGREAAQTLLFIPKEVFVTDFAQFNGHSWARGMLAYAVTGVPLLHGLETLDKKYGYADYDESALWVERAGFDASAACTTFGKDVIIVESFEKPDFSLFECN